VLADLLGKLGYEVSTGIGSTGVVATLTNGNGPTVMIRADMDGLPVLEATGLPYASTVRSTDPAGVDVPVMHACGHDMHATWLIGAAERLASALDTWSGQIVLVAQPAEELGAGAASMLAGGLMEVSGKPDVVLGQHVTPAPAGALAIRGGAVMSAADTVRVIMHGRGGHGATPEQSVDPVVMAAATVLRLQTVVSRELGMNERAVLTVGMMQAGTKENVIADKATLGLSIRTAHPEVRERVLAAVQRIVRAEAVAAGAEREPDIETTFSLPALVNDDEAATRVTEAFTSAFGAERVQTDAPLASASEDFGLLGERLGAPSVFWFVGGTDPERHAAAEAAGRIRQEIPFNHSPLFAPVPELTISVGVDAMVSAARAWLAA
jgi:hippurate hydrolase